MFGIYLDRNSRVSITAQLCNQLRSKIQSGELPVGTRLPPTRKLAQEYGIARNIVIEAYEQLTAEGYLTGRTGSGTYVSEGIQEHMEDPAPEWEPAPTPAPERAADGVIDFMTGTPDLTLFPRRKWAQYLKRAAEDSADWYDYGDVMGEGELRTALVSYLHRTRGMRCHPDQIFIVSGSSEGLSLLAKAFSPHFHSVYLEDPTIDISQHIFRHLQFRIKPVEVDVSGMKLHELDRLEDGHLMLLTPSHQFPMGSILSIQRRQHAVKLAEQSGSYIIEDDYDGEFRLKGVPVPPLFTLSPSRVIYMGTFSKILAPGLRIGFLVVPPHLVKTVAETKEAMNLRTPAVLQIALARFIRDGQLDRHIHKMKGVYRHRRSLLISALKRHFGDRVVIGGDQAGMHLLAEFPPEYGLVDWQQSLSYGVAVSCVEDYCLVKGKHGHQILLGYGNLQNEEVEEGVKRLRQFVEDTVVPCGAFRDIPGKESGESPHGHPS